MVNLIAVSGGAKEAADYGKILLSDVVITRKRNLFMSRKWRTLDIRMATGILSVHLLALCAPFHFTWGAFFFGCFMYALCGICGITVSFHRNLAHRSFNLPKWLEYTFAYLGVISMQRDPIYWVSMHRYHHQFVDSEKDPHSPTFGFWFSHMGWLFDSGYIMEKYQERKNVEDLKSQAFYRFIKTTYLIHPFAWGSFFYYMGGFPYLSWTMGVAMTFGYHTTFLVNSACHIWGYQAWNTGDLSKNNWWVAILTFGEGWHNNHHAFEFSARHGLEWWQIDCGWYVIRFLEIVGLATDVKLPTEAHKLKKSFARDNKLK
ncbi:palmitoyl-monogalactosyldiacylglycerol delta-7 desaturase, chloroplastic-like [Rutidosis leptorrhynchoides]|uniref:palmitoyl-monogalactosyldiacylglycerol delta-7 desaturase, chloroplastic-like n=1 Tax=Rutidosis leptorrhynchoides TaxID=125765 RepID=UPI003A99BE8D